MAASKKQQEIDLWVAWTSDALGAYEAPDGIDDSEELADDAASFAASYADAMMDAFDARYGATKTKRRGRRRAEEDDE